METDTTGTSAPAVIECTIPTDDIQDGEITDSEPRPKRTDEELVAEYIEKCISGNTNNRHEFKQYLIISNGELHKGGRSIKVPRVQTTFTETNNPLPAGWEETFHHSGLIIYHRHNVVTLSRPYTTNKDNLRSHNIPISAIPCLKQQMDAEVLEKTKTKLHTMNGTTGSTGCPLNNVNADTNADDNDAAKGRQVALKRRFLKLDEVRNYVTKRMPIVKQSQMLYESWPHRRTCHKLINQFKGGDSELAFYEVSFTPDEKRPQDACMIVHDTPVQGQQYEKDARFAFRKVDNPNLRFGVDETGDDVTDDAQGDIECPDDELTPAEVKARLLSKLGVASTSNNKATTNGVSRKRKSATPLPDISSPSKKPTVDLVENDQDSVTPPPADDSPLEAEENSSQYSASIVHSTGSDTIMVILPTVDRRTGKHHTWYTRVLEPLQFLSTYVSKSHMGSAQILDLNTEKGPNMEFRIGIMLKDTLYGVGVGKSKKAARREAAVKTLSALIAGYKELTGVCKGGNEIYASTLDVFKTIPMDHVKLFRTCNQLSVPNPFNVLKCCLDRHRGLVDTTLELVESDDRDPMTNLYHCGMTLGDPAKPKHKVDIYGETKSEAKQLCAATLLKQIHPFIQHYGELLRLYLKPNSLSLLQVSTVKDTKAHELAANKASNEEILAKLKSEMINFAEMCHQEEVPHAQFHQVNL